jgi:hypothetical protein
VGQTKSWIVLLEENCLVQKGTANEGNHMNDEKGAKSFQLAIATAGVIVTALLGFGQWQLSQQQNRMLDEQHKAEAKRASDSIAADKERAADNIEVQVMTLVAPHLAKLRGADKEARNSERIVLAAEEYLSSTYGKTALAQMHRRIVEDSPFVKPETRARIAEATEPVMEGAPWYTVLASLPANDLDAARNIAKEKLKMAERLNLSQDIKVYKTKLSNNYAIVIGGQMARSDAIDLAATARQTGLATDAFAQQDRSWTLMRDE